MIALVCFAGLGVLLILFVFELLLFVLVLGGVSGLFCGY